MSGNRLPFFRKKNEMNMTANSPTPKLAMKDAAELNSDENSAASAKFFSPFSISVSILKPLPNDGNVLTRNSLKSFRAATTDIAALSMLAMEMSLAIPVIIGTSIVSTRSIPPSISMMVMMAYSHEGSPFPLNLSFPKKFITGLPIRATTPAASIYTITSLKNQHIAQMTAAPAVYIMYLASLSILLSFSISVSE